MAAQIRSVHLAVARCVIWWKITATSSAIAFCYVHPTPQSPPGSRKAAAQSSVFTWLKRGPYVFGIRVNLASNSLPSRVIIIY